MKGRISAWISAVGISRFEMYVLFLLKQNINLPHLDQSEKPKQV